MIVDGSLMVDDTSQLSYCEEKLVEHFASKCLPTELPVRLAIRGKDVQVAVLIGFHISALSKPSYYWFDLLPKLKCVVKEKSPYQLETPYVWLATSVFTID